MWDARTPHALHPGRHRLGQPRRHLPRRPRPVAAARRPTTTTAAASTATSRTGRCSRRRRPAPDQPQPGRPGRRAAFALAAQVDAAHHRPGLGASCARRRLLYARADTSQTADAARDRAAARVLPREQLARRHGARRRRDRTRRAIASADRPRRYVRDAGAVGHGATSATESGDTLNLYDTSALAHADAGRGPCGARARTLAVDPAADLVARPAPPDPLARCGTRRGRPLRGRRARTTTSTSTPTRSGWSPRSALYDLLTGTRRFQRFATAQRDWLLGGNPWGVERDGRGRCTRSRCCMQHQVANLSGTTDGTPPIDVGAVVNGPNGGRQLRRRPRRLPGRHGAAARRHAPTGTPRSTADGSRYVDDVRVLADRRAGAGHDGRGRSSPPPPSWRSISVDECAQWLRPTAVGGLVPSGASSGWRGTGLTGIRQVRRVPLPGGLLTSSVPSTAAIRSARPDKPDPRRWSAPPTPSSMTSRTTLSAAPRDRDGHLRGAGILRNVGQGLGDDEVEAALDRSTRALVEVVPEHDRHG